MKLNKVVHVKEIKGVLMKLNIEEVHIKAIKVVHMKEIKRVPGAKTEL